MLEELQFRKIVKRNSSLMTDWRVFRSVGNRRFPHIPAPGIQISERLMNLPVLHTPARLRARRYCAPPKIQSDTSRCCVYQHWKINGNPWRRCPASMMANECARLSPPLVCENVAYSHADRRAHSAANCRTEQTWVLR